MNGTGEVSEYENVNPTGKYELNEKQKGKFYFPKHYMNSKTGPGFKNNPKSVIGLPGKRVPDHLEYTEDHPQGHIHDGHHPHGHGIEEHHGKEHHPHHHISGYGYQHHYGGYRHTIGDKVDAVGKALHFLIPSALLLTGVSALFPNRVHVPTTPNNHRQKRSLLRRRSNYRGIGPPPPHDAPIQPEFEDIPSHILHAEHRIMESSPEVVYPEQQDYGNRVSHQSAENGGFNPFRVFKGPGSSETTVHAMQAAIVMPDFPDMPNMDAAHDKNNQYLQSFSSMGPEQSGENLPPTSYMPESQELPPTRETKPRRPIIRRPHHPPTTNFDDYSTKLEPLEKPAGEQSEKSYLVKNSIDDPKLVNQEKAEQEFMSSLQNLVTPDIAKALVENKRQEPPKDVDLSPDGPVMGLLTSYAQHETRLLNVRERALCELAVKGKGPNSSKFESFLWSVATLVPDVFSEMYDLQEVFQAIRDERCARFDCIAPNLDIQLHK
ncbi:hypothetical protein Ocin01_19226 [Orchesella cincta]|uniref:Uncharacterized protein n=1 Tax=Orchesella cincta TaxID=48709 RepID=A0A1D2M3C1_ORCCI|nr:hypothetical protein Ocin01_19226 [Orchesella cincta]